MSDIEHAANAVEKYAEAMTFRAVRRMVEDRFEEIFWTLYGVQLEINYDEPSEDQRTLTIKWWSYDDEDMKKVLNP